MVFPSTECKICQNWFDCIQSLTFLRKTKPKDSPSPLHQQFIQVVHNEALASRVHPKSDTAGGLRCTEVRALVVISTKKNRTKQNVQSEIVCLQINFLESVKVSTREVESCWKDWDL